MSINVLSLIHSLSTPTQFFGLKLWTTLLICIGLLIMITTLLIIICLCCCSSSSCCRFRPQNKLNRTCSVCSSRVLQRGFSSREAAIYSGRMMSGRTGSGIDHVVDMHMLQPVTSGAWRCNNYSAREIHLATGGFSQGYMISTSGREHGDNQVYRGILFDGKRVAVKILICTSDNVDEFIEQVEAIWCIRHKNLVKLLGYSIEGPKRMLVYEYINNGNLHKWLHGRKTRVINPLTWNIRMNIISGITKGLVCLLEDSEPIVTHRRLKSSCILLDSHWNPKISYSGITKLLDSQSIAHSLDGMSGYIAPECIIAPNMNEKSDIYSFGVLIMEIISGRKPVEIIEFGKKEYLVEWVKSKVSDQEFDDILDPSLPELPSSKELKRIILIALRCVDPEVENRPTIGDVIHMLEPRDLLLDDDSVADI